MAITRRQFNNFLKLINGRLDPTWAIASGLLKNHKIYLKVNRLSTDPKYDYDPMTDPYVLHVSLETGSIYLSNENQIRFEAVVYSKSIEELKSKFYIVSDL